MFKSVVFIMGQTRVPAYFPFATSSSSFFFQLAFLNAFHCRQMACLVQAPTQPHCLYQSPTGRRSRWNNMVHHKHSNFFYSLVIFRQYFTGNGKVSCMLATCTIYDWFPNKKIENKSCVVVFFSYRTKHKLPAGNQFWKFSRHCSIFGRIGDQWVAISSPG